MSVHILCFNFHTILMVKVKSPYAAECLIYGKRAAMAEEKIIRGADEPQVWQQLTSDLQKEELLQYNAAIEQDGRQLYLDIDIDLGGGFESGYATTTLTAPVTATGDFEFAIHPQHITDGIGKFFGMQDVVIGYPDFDEKLIIRTNNAAKVKAVFAEDAIREQCLSLPDFTFELRHDPDVEGGHMLQLVIEEGITQVAVLRSIYHAFYEVLIRISAI